MTISLPDRGSCVRELNVRDYCVWEWCLDYGDVQYDQAFNNLF